jgi:EmrB/QacA subfamily drug resistance transporter
MGGSAPTEDALIFARVLQGFSAGVAQPLVMATIFTVFPPERRGMAMGVFGLGVVFAPAIGPTLGGLMIEYFSWRYVFFISLPFCVVAAVMGMIFMPTRSIPKVIPPFDWLGFALLCTALFGLMTGIADGQREGWSSDAIVFRLVLGGAATVGFVCWELYTPRALLDVRIFANVEFAAAALIAFIFGAGMMGSTYIIPVFVQTIIGFTPLEAGLMMMPAGIMLAFIFPLAGRLSDSMPASTMIIGGLVLFAGGFAWMTTADIDTTFWTLVCMVMLSRLGLGFINPSLNASSLKALPADKVRQGSGVANFMRQLGGAFGINGMVAFFEIRTRFHADALTATQDWGNRTTDRMLTQVEHLMQKSGLPFQHQKAGALEYLATMLQSNAQMLAFSDTFIVVGVVALAALIPAAMLSRSQRRSRG